MAFGFKNTDLRIPFLWLAQALQAINGYTTYQNAIMNYQYYWAADALPAVCRMLFCFSTVRITDI